MVDIIALVIPHALLALAALRLAMRDDLDKDSALGATPEPDCAKVNSPHA